MVSTSVPVEYTCSEDEPVSHTVIAAVSEVTNCDPIELDPLYEYIDPEALDTIFRSSSTGDTNHDEVCLEFDYKTTRVTVTPDYVHIDTREEV